jgi:hypothetical protein
MLACNWLKIKRKEWDVFVSRVALPPQHINQFLQKSELSLFRIFVDVSNYKPMPEPMPEDVVGVHKEPNAVLEQ